MVLGVSKYGVKVASLDQCVSRAGLCLTSHQEVVAITSLTQRDIKVKRSPRSGDQDVLHRHPLYLIVRMLCYDDGLGAGKNLLALKTTDAQQEECSIWVYQCSSSVRAGSTCSHAERRHAKGCDLLLSVFAGAGSVHLQGAVRFLRLRSVLGQVLMFTHGGGSRRRM